MLSVLMLAIATTTPLTTAVTPICDGVRQIETAAGDRPLAFASLRETIKSIAIVRDAAGKRVEREVPVTQVKALAGFTRCRFVYSVHIDLACYIESSVAEDDSQSAASALLGAADSVGGCLTNPNLVRGESETGSSPTVTFGAGPDHPLWQISMVPVEGDFARVQPEVLILGPVQRPVPTLKPRKPVVAKAKRKRA